MVKLRLTRMGSINKPFYRVVAVDSRARRDGKYLDNVGYYDPKHNPAVIKIDEEKAIKWLKVGAQPTETVTSLFRKAGVLKKWHEMRYGKKEVEAAVKEVAPKKAKATAAEKAEEAAPKKAKAKAIEKVEEVVSEKVEEIVSETPKPKRTRAKKVVEETPPPVAETSTETVETPEPAAVVAPELPDTAAEVAEDIAPTELSTETDKED